MALLKNKKVIVIVIAIIAVVVIGGVIGYMTNVLSGDEKLAVQNVTAQIDKIGPVTIENEGLINAAKNGFNALNEKEQKHVLNKQKLTDAVQTLESLEIANVEDAINKIGAVTLESQSTIAAASLLFDGLGADLQAKITNQDTLTAAIAQFSAVAIANATSLIDAIGEVTLDSENAIIAAEEAFKALGTDTQAEITNAAALTQARQTFEQLKQEAADQALLLTPGEKITNDSVQIKYKETVLTPAIYPDNTDTDAAYTFFPSHDKEIYLDTVLTIKNISAEPVLINTILSSYITTYNLTTYGKYTCYFSTGDTISPVGETDSIEAKKSITLHITVSLPQEAKKTDFPIRVETTIVGEKHVIAFR